MMLDYGKYGRTRVLSRASVELMTTDRLTPEQTALSVSFRNVRQHRLGFRHGGRDAPR
jgi:hypothetical protein